MPKAPAAVKCCRRCGGSISLPHAEKTDCRIALSMEVAALLARARKLSNTMWTLARVERRGATRHTAVATGRERSKNRSQRRDG
jgi:hypothetical protein